MSTALCVPRSFRINLLKRVVSDRIPKKISGAEEDLSLILNSHYYPKGVQDKSFWRILNADELLKYHRGKEFGWNKPIFNSTKVNTDASVKILDQTKEVEKKLRDEVEKYTHVVYEAGLFRTWAPNGPRLDIILHRFVLYSRKPSVLRHELSALSMSLQFCIEHKQIFRKIQLSTDSYWVVMLVIQNFTPIDEEAAEKLEEILKNQGQDRDACEEIASEMKLLLQKHYGGDAFTCWNLIKWCAREGNFSADCCTNFAKDTEMEDEIKLSKGDSGKIFSITKVSNTLRTILRKDNHSNYIHFPRHYHAGTEPLQRTMEGSLPMAKQELQVYSIISKQKGIVFPKEPGKAGMYVCGVTAYDLSHIGHARAYIPCDVLYRYMEHLGYEVPHARNFTNFDDKVSMFWSIWMHNGFVNTNHEKMSKSLGNFYTIREAKQQQHSLFLSLAEMEKEVKMVLDTHGLLSSLSYSEVLEQFKAEALT